MTRTATTARPSPRSCARAWWLALWLSLPAAAAPAGAGPGAIDPAAIDRDIAAILHRQGLTGATWALVDPAQGVRVGAAGIKDARTEVGLRPDDKVQVGSVTKPLLATGILRLVSTGRLRLDQPVAELLPAIAFDNPWAATDPPRLRHLLDHSAGLDDARLSQIFTRVPGPDTPLAEAFARDRGVLRVRSRPGTRTSYSNSGYTLLGMVIEAVTGERYETYLDRELLRPLGMRDSSFGYVSQAGPGADPRLAMGHFDDGSAHPTVPMYLRPGGQFSTTAADMARFARFLMSDGRIDGAAFVEPALLRGMGRPLETEAARAGLRVGYAQGLMTRDRHGATGLCHGGSTVGFRAMLCVFPQQQRGFFLAVNADNETADYGALDRRLIQALALPAPAPAPAPMRPARLALAEWEGYYVPSPNRMASFAWLDTTFGYVRVRRDGAGLRLTPLQGRQSELIPLGGALLRASDRIQASHALVIASDGARVIATGTQSYERIARWKLLALWASLVAGGAGLLWLLARGLIGAARRRLRIGDPLFAPWLAILGLSLPLPWLYRQSFLQLGDLTVGSALLTAVTALLPAALLLGLWRYRRQRAAASRASTVDALAMAALLQWTAVLAAWGLWPVRLWA